MLLIENDVEYFILIAKLSLCPEMFFIMNTYSLLPKSILISPFKSSQTDNESQSSDPAPNTVLVDQTRGGRTISKPSWLKDYICSSSSPCVSTNMQKIDEFEPTNFGQANKSENWIIAMKEELEALIRNET